MAELARLLGCTVLVGVRVGDAIVFTDLVGEESPSLTFVARTHARRPLYTSAAGKTLLANVPDDEMYRLLDLVRPEQAGEVRQFLAGLPEIRTRRLAINRGVTLADAFGVATPLLTPDGSLIAAISAAVDASEADRLDAIGEQAKDRPLPPSVRNTGSNRAEQARHRGVATAKPPAAARAVTVSGQR